MPHQVAEMIAYVATAVHGFTMTWYLRTWGIALSRRIKVLAYESLPPVDEVKAITWIFSDLDRLSTAQTQGATALWERLSEADPPVQLLNDPRRVLGRYDLLLRLHEAGVNSFRAYRVAEAPKAPRFPVFLREANQHRGSLPGLLTTGKALQRAISVALAEGHGEDDLLIVEFCDTADAAGNYRKYGAFRVGEAIVPRHLIKSRSWEVKVDQDLLDRRKLAEEREYLTRNPHEEVLRELFQLAGIDYGRIDYSLLDGKAQVWEINTNPMPVSLPWEHKIRRLSNHRLFAREMRSAFESLDRRPSP